LRVAGFPLPESSYAFQGIIEFDALIVLINQPSKQLNQPVNPIIPST
jgi:hypothetical protein